MLKGKKYLRDRRKFVFLMATAALEEYNENEGYDNPSPLTFVDCILEYGAKVTPKLTRTEVVRILTKADLRRQPLTKKD